MCSTEEDMFRIVAGVWKNPQDIHKRIHIILSGTSIRITRSLQWGVKIS